MKKQLVKRVVMCGLLMAMTPQMVLSQTINNQEGSIAREFETPNEEEIIKRMQAKIKELMSLSMEDVEPANLATPDYDLVRKVLQAKISDSLVIYFEQLELINQEVKKVFSELIALKNYAAKKESDPKGPLHQEYLKDLRLKIPSLNKKINDLYAKAVKSLVLLDGSQPIPLTKKRDQFKQKRDFDYGKTLLQLCESSLCVKSLTADILNWNEFAANFNQKVDFVNFTPVRINTTGGNVRTTPFITNSLLNAASKLLKLGTKANKQYTVPGIVASVALDTVKVPAAIGTALISIPMFLVEKPIRLLGTQSFKTIKLDLALDSLEAYPLNQLKNSLYAWSDKISKRRTSAIYYSSSEEAEKLRSVILNVQKDAAYYHKTNALDQFTNQELLDLEARGILSFEILGQTLSAERFAALSNEVPQDIKEAILVKNARRDAKEIVKLSFKQKVLLLEEEKVSLKAYLPFLADDLKKLLASSEIISVKYYAIQDELLLQERAKQISVIVNNPALIRDAEVSIIIEVLENQQNQFARFYPHLKDRIKELTRISPVVQKRYSFYSMNGTRLESPGNYTEWRSGYCYEFNAAGRNVRQTTDEYCEGENNYKWSSSGYCYEYNNGGRNLGQKEDNLCSGQNYFKWTSNGYCYEYNSAGRNLGQREDRYCSQQAK